MTELDKPPRGRRYWASRPDRENLDYFRDELAAGRLRQGWGYTPEQSLDVIRAKVDGGGQWWTQLSPEQLDAFRNYPFHTGWGEDTMHAGDVVLVPNLPTWGFFSLAEVVDNEYHYDAMPSEKEDYGHWRAVRLLTPGGLPSDHAGVDANVRATLRCRSRIWRVDHLSTSLESLVATASAGSIDRKDRMNPQQRFDSLIKAAGESAHASAFSSAVEHLGKDLEKAFYAAELETAVAGALGILFSGSTIEMRGGGNGASSEAVHGTDLLVKIRNPLSDDQPLLIAVQVKNHTGETDDGAEQLRKAANYWGTKVNSTEDGPAAPLERSEGQLVGLALVTTADSVSSAAENALHAIRREFGLPVYVVTKMRLIGLLAEASLQRHAFAR